MDARLNPLHWHRCCSCEEEVICCCADKAQPVLCFACNNLEERLRALLGERTELEKVG